MSYMNDPREMAIRPESGVTLEQDNRVETMYQWGAMILDLCDLPVSEYMKPMTVNCNCGSGSDSGNTPMPSTVENIKIYLSVLKNGVVQSTDYVLSASEDNVPSDSTIWTARWEWTGSFPGEIKVTAVIKTDVGEYTVSQNISDNKEKKHEYNIEEAKDSEALVSFKNYGVGSVEDSLEDIDSTYEVVDNETNTTYKYEVSTDEKIVYLTLKFIVDGVTKFTKNDMRYGEEIPFSAVTVGKEGYTFDGWFDEKGKEYVEGDKMPATNLTLKGKYSVKKCEVVFIFDIDGDQSVVSSYTVNYGSKITKIPSTIKVGYDFNGWEPSVSTSTIVKDDITFVGKFTSKIYTVIWSGYTGEEYPNGVLEQTYKYGEDLIQPINPEKEGYTFTKWDKTIPQKVTSNLKFTAVYKINSYKLTYVMDSEGDRTELSAYTLNYGVKIPVKSVPTQKGYTFSQWEGYEDGMTMPSNDVEFITYRTANKYVLSYFDNNVLVNEETYPYGAEIIPFEYEKEGWIVSEWKNLPKTMPYNNVSAYCTSEISRFVVVFEDQDGNEYILEGVEYGTLVSNIIPEIEGKTFTVNDFNILNSKVNRDMVILGTVTPNYYDVYIVVNGEPSDITKLPYGTIVDDFINETFPPEEGYQIVIDKNYDTVPANNSLVVEVSYVANEWKLTYITNDDVNGEVIVAYNELILPYLPNIEKEGKDFSGWQIVGGETITSESKMPNHDIEVVGEYSIKMFTISIVDNGNTIYSDRYPYGTLLEEVLNNTEIVDFVNEQSANGYTVIFDIDGNVVNGDMTVTSDLLINVTRTPNMYLLTFVNGEEVISSSNIYFGEIITYPNVENKTENGIEYVFVWDDMSYNGLPMPAQDIVINGSYQEKSKGSIYYGSFVILKNDFSDEKLSEYFKVEDLNTEYYGSVEVDPCVGEGSSFILKMPIYEPLVGLSQVKYLTERPKYREPLTLLIPVEVIDKYNVSVLDFIKSDLWDEYKTNNEKVLIDGIEYYFYVYNTESLMPANEIQEIELTLKLTEK